MLSRTRVLSVGAALRDLRGGTKPIPMFPGSFSWTLPTDIALVAERGSSLSIRTSAQPTSEASVLLLQSQVYLR